MSSRKGCSLVTKMAASGVEQVVADVPLGSWVFLPRSDGVALAIVCQLDVKGWTGPGEKTLLLVRPQVEIYEDFRQAQRLPVFVLPDGLVIAPIGEPRFGGSNFVDNGVFVVVGAKSYLVINYPMFLDWETSKVIAVDSLGPLKVRFPGWAVYRTESTPELRNAQPIFSWAADAARQSSNSR